MCEAAVRLSRKRYASESRPKQLQRLRHPEIEVNPQVLLQVDHRRHMLRRRKKGSRKSQRMKRRRRRTVKMKQRAAMKTRLPGRTPGVKQPTQAGARGGTQATILVGGKRRIPNHGHGQRLETSTTSQRQAQAGRGRQRQGKSQLF